MITSLKQTCFNFESIVKMKLTIENNSSLSINENESKIILLIDSEKLKTFDDEKLKTLLFDDKKSFVIIV